MKLSLIVLSEGKQKGKALDVKLPQFLIGRDPQCHLRPVSALISKRHCAIIKREGRAFIRDFDSTNGTFVNDEQVKGEVELKNDDRLKIGPMLFSVRMEQGPAVNKPTPPPATKGKVKPTLKSAAKPTAEATEKPTEDSDAATKPSTTGEPGGDLAPANPPGPSKPAPVPAGSSTDTGGSGEEDDILAMLLSTEDNENSAPLSPSDVPEGSTVFDMPLPPELAAEKAKEEKNQEKKETSSGNTASAAKDILEQYMRRPRS